MFWNDWLTPAPLIQPSEKDGDYVELYDAGADADSDDGASDDVYEDIYGHPNSNNDLDNQVAQENNVCEDHDVGDSIDKSVDDIDNSHDDANRSRLVYSVTHTCFIILELIASLLYFQNVAYFLER